MGFTIVPCGQGFKDMSPPTKELMKLTLEQKLAHGGHPVLRWMMDNVYIRTDPAGNVKADKEKSTEKICGAVATIMGLDRAIPVEIIPVLLSTMIDAFFSCKMQKLSVFNSFCISVHKLDFFINLCYTLFTRRNAK